MDLDIARNIIVDIFDDFLREVLVLGLTANEDDFLALVSISSFKTFETYVQCNI